uniref:Uncharacterized protein n=1 Tax=viral metagenome TaxID=1070528 RepID=A0A6C0J6Z8_9ZZZZ
MMTLSNNNKGVIIVIFFALAALFIFKQYKSNLQVGGHTLSGALSDDINEDKIGYNIRKVNKNTLRPYVKKRVKKSILDFFDSVTSSQKGGEGDDGKPSGFFLWPVSDGDDTIRRWQHRVYDNTFYTLNKKAINKMERKMYKNYRKIIEKL